MTESHQIGDLFSSLPSKSVGDEVFEDLLTRDGVRVERITSWGRASVPGEWCDQEWAEWVLILRGEATLEIERGDGATERVDLRPGGWLDLPAHRRHRVLQTAPDEPTIWLAVHWPPARS